MKAEESHTQFNHRRDYQVNLDGDAEKASLRPLRHVLVMRTAVQIVYTVRWPNELWEFNRDYDQRAAR